MTERERELRQMIKDGDDAGYFYLGYMYELGEEVEQDYAKAAQWYKKGADAGNPTCKLNLGCLYINGDGVEADWDLGLKYSLEASEEIADESAAVASINAALLYRLSDKHRDYDKCEEMCLRAIEKTRRDIVSSAWRRFWAIIRILSHLTFLKEWERESSAPWRRDAREQYP